MKPKLKFHAVKANPTGHGFGPLTIEASRDGSNWVAAISGLSHDEVQHAFESVHLHGCPIVDTPDFTFTPPPPVVAEPAAPAPEEVAA